MSTFNQREITQRIRTKDLCLALQVSRMALWRWSKLDGFPVPLKRGGIVLWDARAVGQWLENNNRNA